MTWAFLPHPSVRDRHGTEEERKRSIVFICRFTVSVHMGFV